MEPLLILAALMFLAKKKPTQIEQIREIERSFPTVAPTVAPKIDHAQVEQFRRRAAQQRARDWIPHLIAAGASPELAAGLARWIGIESSGNPIAVSKIGERGLLQATKTSALAEKLFTPAEWGALNSPNTTKAQHAKLALKQFGYHVARARRWVVNPPPITDVASWLYYAKAHHSRPKDLTDDKVHGPGALMNRELLKRHEGKPDRSKRIYSAMVVANV